MPPIEATVRNLEPADHRAVHRCRQSACAGDNQLVRLHGDLDVLWFNAGQGGNDGQALIGLQDVDRRFPIGRRHGLEELPMQLLGALDHGAGLGPHPTSRIGCTHGSCSDRSNGSASSSWDPGRNSNVPLRDRAGLLHSNRQLNGRTGLLFPIVDRRRHAVLRLAP
jgi:hypothetical protein